VVPRPVGGWGRRRPRRARGQQQRVAIVRALANRPRALPDEPTSALDSEPVGEVLELIRGRKADGMTMVLVTHEMAFAREVADEVCVLHAGRLLERGEPQRISPSPARPRRPARCAG
jgi:polar amino acid transport system ATP-binding protein